MTNTGLFWIVLASFLTGGMVAMLCAAFLPQLLVGVTVAPPGSLLIGAMITGCAALICWSWVP